MYKYALKNEFLCTLLNLYKFINFNNSNNKGCEFVENFRICRF